MKLIASVLLVLAGTEVVVMAPFAFEVAALIDAFGLIFVVSLAGDWLRSHGALFWTRIADLGRAAFRGVDRLANLGSGIPVTWQLCIGRVCRPSGKFVIVTILSAAALNVIGKLPIWR